MKAIIGYTKTGKPLLEDQYAHHENCANFTPQEHRDAVLVFEAENLHNIAESHYHTALKKVHNRKAK